MALFNLFLGLVLVAGSVSARAAVSLDDALIGYRDVATALAKDDYADTAAKATKLLTVAEELGQTDGPLAAHYFKLASGAKAMAASTKEIELRKTMSILSEGAVWLVKNSPALQSKWQLYKCPMVTGRFQFWMQPMGDIMANPYMGTAMLQCGVRRAWTKFP
jgi:hypothetical protein